MPSVRRSGRVRKPMETIYDSAAQAARSTPSKTNSSSKKHRKSSVEKNHRDNEESNDDASAISHNEEQEMEEDVSSSSSSEEEESEAEEATKKPTRKRKSPTTNQVNREMTEAAATVSKSKTTRRAPLPGNNHTTLTKRQAGGLLTNLAKRAMDAEETSENSLAMALLLSFRDDKGTKKRRTKSNGEETSHYQAGLQTIARQLINDHKEHPNAVEVKLLNLVLRSIGGKTLLPADADLEEMMDDEWGETIEQLVEEMEGTSADQTLLTLGKTTAAGLEYSKVYAEFWRELAATALAESDDDNNHDTTTFALEWARDTMARLLELVNVGLPELRMAVAVPVYQFGQAMLERTAALRIKLTTAQRQHATALKASSSRKAEALEQQIDSWRRSVVNMEEMVKETVMAMFMKRFKDSNEHIRTYSLTALQGYCRCRPDIFVTSYYLKYFGWMLSDLKGCVRVASVQGLLTPFRDKLDTSNMKNVIAKFTGRLTDCVLDVDVRVQEAAMELLLILLKQDYMDDVEDDRIWHQINNRSLATETSPLVRKNALYFVIDQLDSFDTETGSENHAIDQLSALANFVAHTLSDGEIPIDQIRYELSDLIVASLRDMPEYKSLVTNWSAFLKSLQGHGRRRKSGNHNKINQRQDTVKDRVLLRMLVTAAKMEVEHAMPDTSEWMDPALSEIALDDNGATKKRKTKTSLKKSESSSHEELTMALLRALPELILSYKSESPILQSLLTLPQYFLPSVLNLSSRKKEFKTLLSNLFDVFLESTDPCTLATCCRALVALASGNHSRSDDALLVLKQIASKLRSRLQDLFESKSRQASNAEANDSDDEAMSYHDTDSSISLCLRRLLVLSKRWSVTELWEDKGRGRAELEVICADISAYLTSELRARRVIYHGQETQGDADQVEIPKMWIQTDDKVHAAISDSVSEGMGFLLTETAWQLKRAIAAIDNGEEMDEETIDDHIVLRNRDRMKDLLRLCYEHYIQHDNSSEYSEAHESFSVHVQQHALRIAGDLRALFPRKWSEAASPFLSRCSFTEDSIIVGAGVRFARSQEFKIREAEEGSEEKHKYIASYLYPLIRGIGTNWETGNRKEAGAVLAHIVGSGKQTHDIVVAFSRVLKRQQPVRFLESHMACLRQDFEAWADDEPEEPSDRPTESEMAEYEKEEKRHEKRFEAINSQASRLSASLGVGKIRDKALAPSLNGFVREGIRFAFSTDENGSDEPLPLGCRLLFLNVLSKYLNWIRREKHAKADVSQFLNSLETDLRNHSEFTEVYSQDIEAIAEFRKVGDLGEFYADDAETQASAFGSTRGSTFSGASRSPARMSIGSSVSSIRSKESKRSLKSIVETAEEESSGNDGADAGSRTSFDEDTANLSRNSRTKRSLASVSTTKSQSSLKENEENSDMDDATDAMHHSQKSAKRSRTSKPPKRSDASVSTIGDDHNSRISDEDSASLM